MSTESAEGRLTIVQRHAPAGLVSKLRDGCSWLAVDVAGAMVEAAVEHRVQAVQFSADDVCDVAGACCDTYQAARWIVGQGVGLAIAVDGDGDVLAVTRSRCLRARRPPRARVAIGPPAPAVMLAGLVSARLRGLSDEDQLRLAASCGWVSSQSSNGRLCMRLVGATMKETRVQAGS